MIRFEKTLSNNSFGKKMKKEVVQIQLSRENMHLNKTIKNTATNEFFIYSSMATNWLK